MHEVFDLSDQEPMNGAGPVPRARRFPIEAPLRYRESGGSAWIEGTTVNISRSGVLFWAATDLEARTLLEMQIRFPTEITGGLPANVVCWGPVVRSEQPEPPDPRPKLAASIVRYRLAPEWPIC